MSNLLYIITIIFLICWLVGYFVLTLGSLIHILLVLAVISILFQLIGGRRA